MPSEALAICTDPAAAYPAALANDPIHCLRPESAEGERYLLPPAALRYPGMRIDAAQAEDQDPLPWHQEMRTHPLFKEMGRKRNVAKISNKKFASIAKMAPLG